MKSFQGWKVKIGAATAVLLVIGGSTTALWPKSAVTASQTGIAHVSLAPPIVSTLKASIAGTEPAQPNTPPAGDTPTNMPPTTIPVVTKPLTPTPTPTPDPVPTPITDPTPVPVDPPVVIHPPYIAPGHCGGCGQVSETKGIMCPMTTNGSMSAQICRLDTN